MLVLLGIGFLAGVITSLSPCVLPVLPILLAGSASGGRRRPYAIIGGLVASFSAFTLTAAWLLDALGLPKDLLRNLALALLFLVAATLIFPRLGRLVERPFARLTRRSGRDLGGGFVLGASLGLVFVPCAGPVLAAISVLSANRDVDLAGVGLTIAYASGAAVPMLLIALAGQRASERTRALRTHAQTVRQALGVVVAATALAIVLDVDRRFQTAVPGYTEALQGKIEDTAYAKDRLSQLRDDESGSTEAATGKALDDFGAAPEFAGVSHWLNTPGGRALTLRRLRGKVVLIDFWTYSCINCLRTLPHVKAWDAAYRGRGLVIVGVHTPEFAFEHELSNVREAVSDLGVRYPVALDNDYGTWNAYSNQYWPAKYLIDRRGRVRFAHFGEGEYDATENYVRQLLAERPGPLPRPVGKPDRTPNEALTPESYLGYQRLEGYVGTPILPDLPRRYRFPTRLGDGQLAYEGLWRVESERIVAGPGARLRLRFRAREVYLVLGGRGKVAVLVDGRPHGTVRVRGSRLYTLARFPSAGEALLELRLTPGLAAYAFTFG